MSISFSELQQLLRGEDIRFFVEPGAPRALFAASGLHGSYNVAVMLELDGEFLQLRALQYLRCAADHPHLLAVLKTIAHINYQKRLVKFAWDPADGEVTLYADLWVSDGTVTQGQFNRLTGSFLRALDLSFPAIKAALETGQQTGESELPAGFEALVEKFLRGGGPKKDDPEVTEI